MKVGMNLLLWNGSITSEHFPLLGKLKATGFDGVELPVFGGSPAGGTIEDESDVLGKLRARGAIGRRERVP